MGLVIEMIATTQRFPEPLDSGRIHVRLFDWPQVFFERRASRRRRAVTMQFGQLCFARKCQSLAAHKVLCTRHCAVKSLGQKLRAITSARRHEPTADVYLQAGGNRDERSTAEASKVVRDVISAWNEHV